MKYGFTQKLKTGLVILFLLSMVACAASSVEINTGLTDQDDPMGKARFFFLKEDYQMALQFLRPLAENGNADAEYAMGYLYYKGLGVSQDDDQANHWLIRSAVKGNKKAIKALRHLPQFINLPARQDAAKSTAPDVVEPSQTMDVTEADKDPLNKLPLSVIFSRIVPVVEKKVKKEAEKEVKKVVEKEQALDAVEPSGKIKKTPVVEKRLTIPKAEQWILNQPDEHYTIQLIALNNEPSMQRFIKENKLQDSVVYYKTRRNGHDLFTLIQGSFASLSEARDIIKHLASPLQQAQPWVKPIVSIQALILDRQN